MELVEAVAAVDLPTPVAPVELPPAGLPSVESLPLGLLRVALPAASHGGPRAELLAPLLADHLVGLLPLRAVTN